MPSMKRAGITSASKTSALEQFHQTAGSPWIAGDRLPLDFIKKAGSGKQNRFCETFRNGVADTRIRDQKVRSVVLQNC